MGLKKANRSVWLFLSIYPLDADRFWREALARMRLVRKVFWEGYMTYQRVSYESTVQGYGIRTIVLDVGGGVDGLWKGDEN